MTLTRHELRQGRRSLIIWTAAIAFFLGICIFLYPEMKGEVDSISEAFSSMGSFTAAFGMDRLDFGSLVGFYAIECGNIMSVGGAFFAALIGISALANEEKERTAEFLCTHPISRLQILWGKLFSLIISLVVLNAVSYAFSVGSIFCIGESVPWKEINLLHGAYFLVQLEICLICFGVSAFIRRGGLGIGLGLAAVLYFVNIIANISDQAKWLKYVTPFGFADGADIVSEGCLDLTLIVFGLLAGCVFTAVGFVKYCRKDIL